MKGWMINHPALYQSPIISLLIVEYCPSCALFPTEGILSRELGHGETSRHVRESPLLPDP